jgi:hypothetical protein
MHKKNKYFRVKVHNFHHVVTFRILAVTTANYSKISPKILNIYDKSVIMWYNNNTLTINFPYVNMDLPSANLRNGQSPFPT